MSCFGPAKLFLTNCAGSATNKNKNRQITAIFGSDGALVLTYNNYTGLGVMPFFVIAQQK